MQGERPSSAITLDSATQPTASLISFIPTPMSVRLFAPNTRNITLPVSSLNTFLKVEN